MEKYAKRLQDIINEQDFCFEPEEIRTVEKALGVLKKYEDADVPAEACVEYRKFEDELIRDGMSLQHVLDLLKAEREGRLKVRPESIGQCCGQCHHFLREPMKASGICEVRKNKHYPRAGTPLYCCQSKKPALTSTSAASGPSGIRRHDDGAPDDTKQRRHCISADRTTVEAVFYRLADYEDTNREPAEIRKLEREYRTAVNELCYMCGKYKQEHEGACDGCRWKNPV